MQFKNQITKNASRTQKMR